ncbi:hypothetical protein M9H77_21096 [Catharanthus roseus]|uniref:Uncharacterized protein n=1 Tax=Catharanthus roseus TaxID=4058 RepID=A0ACC0APA2_CATRO|nr:hypothetical protein M9H77_21096 [Catharanthus roseus]
MMMYCESPEYKAFCEHNKRNRNEGWRGGRAGKHTSGCISFTDHQLKRQVDLTERFSKSRHLKELHKHQSGDKKGKGDFRRPDRRSRRKLQARAFLCQMIFN